MRYGAIEMTTVITINWIYFLSLIDATLIPEQDPLFWVSIPKVNTPSPQWHRHMSTDGEFIFKGKALLLDAVHNHSA